MILVPTRILILMLLASLCTGCGTDLQEPAATAVVNQPTEVPVREELRDLTTAEKSILTDGFTAGLNDPDAAKFRWARVPKRLAEHAFEYCGFINIKNSSGRYVGMKPFLATITTENGNIIGGAIAALNNDNLEENRDVIPKLCRRKGLDPFDAK
jgi:hypothetical protein